VDFSHPVFERFLRRNFLLLLRPSGLRRRQSQPKLKSEDPAALDKPGIPVRVTEAASTRYFLEITTSGSKYLAGARSDP
jgi:hypothetical protein